MKIEVVTSFYKSYYEKLGKYSVASFLKRWPEDVSMRIYLEGCHLDEHPRIKQIPISSLDQEYHDFMNSDRWKPRIKNFAHKGYSWVDAVMTSDADYLIWLDADLMTKIDIPKDYIESWCKPELLSSFMGVWFDTKKDKELGVVPLEKPLYGSETCIYFFNLKHPEAKNFAARYKEYYTQGITENLRRFIDTDVFSACVLEYQERGVEFNDFNPKSYKTPLPRTELHPYLQHLKAGLKKMEDLNAYLEEILGEVYHEPTLGVYDGEPDQ